MKGYMNDRIPMFNASLGFHRLLTATLHLAFASTIDKSAREKQAAVVINEVYGRDSVQCIEVEGNHVMLVTASGFRAHLASCYDEVQADALACMLQATHAAMTESVGAMNSALLVLDKLGRVVMPGDVVGEAHGIDVLLHSWHAPHSQASTGRVVVTNNEGGYKEVYPSVYDLRLTNR